MDYVMTSVVQVTSKLYTLGITCYCYLKVIHYLTILLSQNCNALHYLCITFELLSPK